jgi:2-polyprenyl-3-methyl-5-hydroxy-6-metoxy-1,4-benzoquinol methylase
MSPESTTPPTAPEEPDAGLADAVYGAHYYDTYSGGSYEYQGHWREWFGSLADNIIRQFNPRTVLDAGCAKGFLVRALRERGVEAYGVDSSEYAVSHAGDEIKPHVWVGSITEPLKDRYDLITCIEVIEHLPAADLPAAASVLAEGSDRLLLSSTPEGSHLAEPSHISMRPPEDWAALFAGAGLLRNLSADVTWLTPWAMVLERRPSPTLVEVVRDYERRIARDVREIYELRRSAIDQDRRLDELHRTGTARELEERAERAEATAAAADDRVAQALTETLRLRDLLIVAERERGQALGSAQALTDTLRAYQGLADRHHAVMHSTIWRTQMKVLGPYRKLRNRFHR